MYGKVIGTFIQVIKCSIYETRTGSTETTLICRITRLTYKRDHTYMLRIAELRGSIG